MLVLFRSSTEASCSQTPVFTRQFTALLRDDEYRELQQELIFNPAAGTLIKRSGGLRTVAGAPRRSENARGIRVIYYWFVSEDEITMLFAYGKGEKDDLSARELTILRGLVKEC